MDAIFISTYQTPPDWTIGISRSLGPYKLKHFLKKQGYSSRVIDFVSLNENGEYDIPLNQITNLIDKFATKKTLVFGLCATFWSQLTSTLILGIFEYIKKKYPDSKILIGGSVRDEYSLVNIKNYLDGVVRGQGENMLLELMDFYSGKIPEPNYKLESHSGIKIYECSSYQVYDFAKCDFRFDDDDFIKPGEAASLEISRGCIFTCNFCAFQYLGKKKLDYIRDMELVRQELIHNYEKYNITVYNIVDTTFNESVEKMKAFAEMVESLPFKPAFSAFMRLDLLERFPETIEYCERGQIIGHFFGVETMGLRNAKLISKGWSGTQKCKDFLAYLVERWKDKYTIHVNMIVGLPYETEEDNREVLEFLNKIKVPSYYFGGLQVINPDKLGSVVSDFEKNSSKYGFKFDSNGDWYHPETGWTAAKASALADEFNETYEKTRLWTYIWSLPFISSGTNTLDEILTKHVDELNWDKLQENSIKFRDEYYKRILDSV